MKAPDSCKIQEMGGRKMVSIKSFNPSIIFQIFIFTWAVTLAPLVGIAAENEKEAPPKPITTNNLDISLEELEYRLSPLTKDDLSVEADGWLQVLKKHGEELSNTQKTVLVDRLKAVIEEYRSKGGKVDDYEAYIKAVSGVDVKVSDASATWTVIFGWLKSAQGGLRWLKNISFFLVVVLAAWLLAALLGKAARKAVAGIEGASELLKDFIVNIIRKLIFIVGLVVALSMLEINIGPFLATIGAAGFIIAFALQGTLSNFAAGIMILIYRPYDIGDLIDVGGTFGKVDAMTIVSTTLMTVDNKKVVVPNNKIWGDTITNVTGTDKRRVDMVFGIGYSDDIAKAQKILEEILVKHAAVLKDPKPVVKVHELADSSVNFVVRPWAETDNYWDVYWDITRTVKERFDAEGVSIPFPQRDVHMHQAATT
jgi:small conductance mechanosensitive channel